MERQGSFTFIAYVDGAQVLETLRPISTVEICRKYDAKFDRTVPDEKLPVMRYYFKRSRGVRDEPES